MPDPEVGHILTELYRSGPPLPTTTTNPASQPSLHDPNGDRYKVLTPQPDHRTHSSPSAPSLATPIPEAAVSKRTRYRPTKSCERCRDKKLRCDREEPCGACLRGNGDVRRCIYRDGADGEQLRSVKRTKVDPHMPKSHAGLPLMPLPTHGQNGAGAEMVEESHARRDNIWGVSSSLSRPTLATYEVPVQKPSVLAAGTPIRFTAPTPTPTASQNGHPTMMLGRVEIKGSMSRYLGGADRMGLLKKFDDTKSFIGNSVREPRTKEMVLELSAYRSALKPKKSQMLEASISIEELPFQMLKALPSQPDFAPLQSKYISNWEPRFRVLHVPTFLKDCSDMYAPPSSSKVHDLKPHVLPQALAVMAIAARLNDTETSDVAIGGVSEENITHAMDLVRAWLNRLQGKRVLDIHSLQVRALLLIARQGSLIGALELWKESGELVRMAMAMGLHQEPEACVAMPLFTKEIRRRLWITIMELDVNFALLSGMPAALSSSSLNIGIPLNVHDEELSPDMQAYPPNRSLEDWTTTTPEIALSQSLKVRLDVANLLGGNVVLERDVPVLLQQADILERALSYLPSLFRGTTKLGNDNQKRVERLFTSILLEFSLRRALLFIYRIVMQNDTARRYPEARKGMLRTALAILSNLDALDPTVADPSIVRSKNYLDLLHILCRPDIMQAALMLCMQIRSSSQAPSTEHMYREDVSFHKHSLIRVVENILHGMLERLGVFGSDLKDVVALSIVLQSGRSDGTMAEKQALMEAGASRVLAACRRVRPDISEGYKNGTITGRKGHHRDESSDRHGSANTGGQSGGSPMPAADKIWTGYEPSPGSEFDFLNLDFSFDWDINQPWVV